MTTARQASTATLLPSGKVLVVGGLNNSSPALPSAELYEPATGTWTSNALNTARTFHTATLLPNGKVLVAGGNNGSVFLPSAELYDPAFGTWTATGPLTNARGLHTATLLPNGKVLVVGGQGTTGPSAQPLPSAEIYDQITGTWTLTGGLTNARGSHTATLLANGKVLVAGGGQTAPAALLSAELYDPTIGTWSPTGLLTSARRKHTMTLLSNGMVLVAGGQAGSGPLPNAELYDPTVGTLGGDRPAEHRTFQSHRDLAA